MHSQLFSNPDATGYCTLFSAPAGLFVAGLRSQQDQRLREQHIRWYPTGIDEFGAALAAEAGDRVADVSERMHALDG